jgi:hypothetical protein
VYYKGYTESNVHTDSRKRRLHREGNICTVRVSGVADVNVSGRGCVGSPRRWLGSTTTSGQDNLNKAVKFQLLKKRFALREDTFVLLLKG